MQNRVFCVYEEKTNFMFKTSVSVRPWIMNILRFLYVNRTNEHEVILFFQGKNPRQNKTKKRKNLCSNKNLISLLNIYKFLFFW